MSNLVSKFRIHYLAFLVYLSYAIFTTFPLILELNKSLIGRGGLDGFQYAWNIFSFWNQVVHLQSPFFTKIIFYPIGVNLFFSDYSPFTSLIALPFLTHPILFLNLVVIFGIVGSALGAFYLARYITQNNAISLICGFIYGFSPTTGSFILSQHLYYLLASIFLPIGVLIWIKFINTPKKYLTMFIIICWLLFFTNYYFFILLVILCTILLISLLLLDSTSREELLSKLNWSYYLKSFGLLIVLPSLILLYVLASSRDLQNWIGNKSTYAASCNANLAGFITPAKNSLFFSSLSNRAYPLFSFKENGDTPFYYLGVIFVICTISCLIFFRKKKYVASLGITLLVVLLLSLGLQIDFGSAKLLGGRETIFYWFSNLPLLGLIDCPVRFVSGAHLLIALLVGIFLSQVLKYKKFAKLLIIFLFINLIGDYTFSNLPFTHIFTPMIYNYVASSSDNKTVLELPSGLTESKGYFGYDYSIHGLHAMQMYWQTIYKKPRVGGFISRIPKSTYTYFKNEPVIGNLFEMTSYNGRWSGKVYTKKEVENFLNKFNIGYIIFSPGQRQIEYLKKTEELLEGIPYQKFSEEGFVLIKL